MVRVGVAAAAGTAGGAVGLGAFDPEPDMVGGVRKGDEGFGGEIDEVEFFRSAPHVLVDSHKNRSTEL